MKKHLFLTKKRKLDVCNLPYHFEQAIKIVFLNLFKNCSHIYSYIFSHSCSHIFSHSCSCNNSHNHYFSCNDSRIIVVIFKRTNTCSQITLKTLEKSKNYVQS